MKKITAGIISLGLCTALITAGIKTASNVSADEADNEKIETVMLDTGNLEKNAPDVEADGTEQIGAIADNLLNSLLSSDTGSDAKGTAKEETVYVVADATGAKQKVIVSDWIKNGDKEDRLSDKSILTDIINVKGDEKLEKNGNDCVWDAKGSDISYQGNTDKELPIEVKVSYELDGKKMTPEEIKGKSGHVVIRYEYENKTSEEVEIAGKKEKMCVPFVMLTGVLLDDDKFTNIKASTAKLINDGSRTVVIGIALPGLQDNLAIDREKFKIPESLEISADVKDFSLSMSVTVASNEIFGKLDGLDVTSLDSLSDSLAELTDGMSQLMNGSETLSDGLATLMEKSGELEDGVGQLADGALALKNGIAAADSGAGVLAEGAGKLADGTGQLADGAGTLADGAGQLQAGTVQLADGAGALSDGAGQLSDGALALSKGISSLKDGSGKLAAGTESLCDGAGKLSTGAGQLEFGAQALAAGVGQLKTGLDTLASNNDALMGGAGQVFNTMLSAAEKQIKDAGADIPALTIENYANVLQGVVSQLDQAIEAYGKADPSMAAAYKEKSKAVSELKAALDSYNAFYAGLLAYTDGVAQSAEGAGNIKDGADTLATGAGTLKSGVDTLKTGADELNNGMIQLDAGAETLKNGADSLKNGADALKTGTDTLKTGADTLKTGMDSLKTGADSLKSGADSVNAGAGELKNGIGTLKDGTGKLLTGAGALSDGLSELDSNVPALKDGVTQLYDGSVLLKDGIKEFNDRGIEKITEMIEGELEGLIERIRVMGEIAGNYNNFAGIGENMGGTVKFIYRTEEIK